MADFKVTPAAVTEAGNKLNDVHSALARYDDEIRRVAGALNFKIASAGAMRTKVNSIAKNVGTCSVKAGAMSTGAAKIASLYTKTENELKKGRDYGGSGNTPSSGGSSDSGSKDGWKSIVDNIEKILSKFGLGGAVADVFYQFGKVFTGDDPVKAIMKALKSIVDAVGKGFSFSKSPSWLAAFGLNIKDTMGYGESLVDEFGKYVNFDTGADAGVAVTKWLGVALTGAINAYDYGTKVKGGEMSVGDGVASAVIKTVFDVALGAAASAAVGGILVAVGVTSAPAVAVAAGAAVLVIGADLLISKITGGEYSSLTQAATDGVVTAWHGICDFFRDLGQPAYAGGGGGSW